MTIDGIQYSQLPEHLRGGMQRYIENGIPPGDFLTAVICNDLAGAFRCADEVSTTYMRQIVGWFYNEVPSAAWGSRERMDDWVMAHEDKRQSIEECLS